MDPIGSMVRADRIAQGLSLKGLASILNEDRSLGVDRQVTTSWLHHLENDRAKAPSTSVKKGLARALRQDDARYLSASESNDVARRSSFAKFFDEQLSEFEPGSTLVCDVVIDLDRVEDVGEFILCLYHFLVAVDGRVVVFERSQHIAVPVLLLAMRSWPEMDDLNPNAVVSRLLSPAAAGGFVDCQVPVPTVEAMAWVSSRVDVYELVADEQATGLLSAEPFSFLGVISPSGCQGLPRKKLYYYLSPREYGELRGGMAEETYRRFRRYRDLQMFSKCEYGASFAFSYQEMGRHFHLNFANVANVRKA